MPDLTDLRSAFERLEQEVPDHYHSPLIQERVTRLADRHDHVAAHRVPRLRTIATPLLAAAVVAALAVGGAYLRADHTKSPAGNQPTTGRQTSPTPQRSSSATTAHETSPTPQRSSSVPESDTLPTSPTALLSFVQGGRLVNESGYQQSAFGIGQPMQPTPGGTEFTTPSGNIDCGMTGSGATAQVMCEVRQHTWAAAPRPASCTLNWGSGWVTLKAQGVSRGLCLGGPPFAPISNTLPYGAALRHGSLVCRSESTFLACADLTTGQGFAVNRTDLATYR